MVCNVWGFLKVSQSFNGNLMSKVEVLISCVVTTSVMLEICKEYETQRLEMLRFVRMLSDHQKRKSADFIGDL